jgi:hypothetical protein
MLPETTTSLRIAGQKAERRTDMSIFLAPEDVDKKKEVLWQEKK